MPGCAVHMVLADRVLARRVVPSSDGPVRAAFLAGSVAPDMGYFPGGDRFTSDLAHYVRSGCLARALLRAANDECGRAFALGWATHVLADALIHPLINRAAGALDPTRPVPVLTFADDPAAHIRVESGLDAVIASRFGRAALAGRMRLFAPPPAIRILELAYRQTYGLANLGVALRAGCRSVGRAVPAVLAYDQAVAWWLDETPAHRPPAAARAAFPVLQAVLRPFRRTAVYGFAHPVSPPLWLVDEVSVVIASFSDRFADLAATGLAGLPDYNLDTGAVGKIAESYPLAVRTVEALNRRAAT